ncbi:hypothetical protein ACTMU2_22610 [Cupriavidus basilensis]
MRPSSVPPPTHKNKSAAAALRANRCRYVHHTDIRHRDRARPFPHGLQDPEPAAHGRDLGADQALLEAFRRPQGRAGPAGPWWSRSTPGIVYINVLLNEWNRVFYNALEQRDYASFMVLLLRFSWIAAFSSSPRSRGSTTR